jgi:hypothetical protein
MLIELIDNVQVQTGKLQSVQPPFSTLLSLIVKVLLKKITSYAYQLAHNKTLNATK